MSKGFKCSYTRTNLISFYFVLEYIWHHVPFWSHDMMGSSCVCNVTISVCQVTRVWNKKLVTIIWSVLVWLFGAFHRTVHICSELWKPPFRFRILPWSSTFLGLSNQKIMLIKHPDLERREDGELAFKQCHIMDNYTYMQNASLAWIILLAKLFA